MTFKEAGKRRQAILKSRLFEPSVSADGEYRGKTRSFCIADSTSSANLHHSFRRVVLNCFDKHEIRWHDGLDSPQNSNWKWPSNHLCCSQSACVNTFGPMMPDGMDSPYLSFEWIGTENYLGEQTWGSRGKHTTSVDFAFRFRRFDSRIQMVLGEWKYAEEYRRKRLQKPKEINSRQYDTYKDAYIRWESEQPDLPKYEELFVEPFYQLMRLTLMAREMERAYSAGSGEMDAEIVTVILVSPKANCEFSTHFTSPRLSRFGKTVAHAWQNIASPERFLPIDSENILTVIEAVAGEIHKDWRDWLLKRYGWWRS